MDIGKPLRIHNIPDPHRREIRRENGEPEWVREPIRKIDWEPKEQPIPAPNWPTKKPVDVPQDA